MATCTFRATGAVALASTLAPGRAFQISSIRIHLSAVGAAGDFTAKVDANAGSAYDLQILKQDMTAVTDFIFQPEIPLHFDAGDEIDFAWANAGGKTYGLEVKYQPL